MTQTIFFLLAIIVGLIAFINREAYYQWSARRVGQYVVFRVKFPDGRTAEYFVYSEADRVRLFRELDESKSTGRHFAGGSAIVSYEVIDGRNYNRAAVSN